MNHPRLILHLNVADFAVAVERVTDRTLQHKPLIVAPRQSSRAAVYDMSEEAYGDGVRKGMLLSQALRCCRRAQIVAPRFDLYRRAMAAFACEAGRYSPTLEQGAEDGHLYLDITGTHRLFGAAPDVGWRLRRQMRSKFDIDPIWSLATSKLVAKVGSRLVKPRGEYIVADGEEQRFLAPLALQLLPGLSGVERRRLAEFNIGKVGQLAALSRVQLFGVFGRRGEHLFEISRGIDSEAVQNPDRQVPAVQREHVLAEDSAEQRVLAGVLKTLAVDIGMELRGATMAARRVALFLNYSDGGRTVRQATVRLGVSDDASLQRLALLALQRGLTRRTRVRSCRLVCDRLHRISPQLPLFRPVAESVTSDGQRQERLLAAVDAVRRRFGSEAIRSGGQMVLH